MVDDSDQSGPDPEDRDQSPAEPPSAAPAPGQDRPVAPPRTGEPTVDAAVDRLGSLDELPVTEHVDVFDEAHRQLQDSLADLDEG